MPELGVNVAVLKDGQVLLTKREDFEVWCLPGGGVDDGETIAGAAVREVREETGLDVRLVRMVGIYSRPGWRMVGSHIVVFAAEPLSEDICPQAGEVLEARYFPLDQLPEALLVGQVQRIRDALDGASGAAWAQNSPWPFDPSLTRNQIYELRDRSGLSRSDFYLQAYRLQPPVEDILEVPPAVNAVRDLPDGWIDER